jgi:hypothetical protein
MIDTTRYGAVSVTSKTGDHIAGESLRINLGGYLHTFLPRRAGAWGCDPCWNCRQRPAHGERIWMDNYGDLYCDACAHSLESAA